MLEDQLLKLFPLHMRDKLKRADIDQNTLEEIRIRAGQPLMFLYGDGEYFLDESSDALCRQCEHGYRMTRGDLEEMVGFLCNYSMYAYEEQLRMGYLTLRGGHRVGVAGEAAVQQGRIVRLQHIYFLNIRIAREKKGCAKPLVEAVRDTGGIYNTLILSPPGVGKTTYLRDAIRILSEGDYRHPGMKVGVVDERSELGAGYLGIPQNDLGPRTDVLEGAGKSEGIYMLLRSMSPQVIAVDELGAKDDFEAVTRAFHSGCRLIGTIHGESIESLQHICGFFGWSGKGEIGRFIVLEKDADGRRSMQVFNSRMEQIGGQRL
ncbi:MAG: stage III sporulation protein AA [bacterium]|nr:stage III sporulation protein AA [bacterium]MDY4098937.1 stage III sporulation protein AA [Lachnospiraceae bacterium]